MLFKNVMIEALAYEMPDEVVLSSDLEAQIEPLMTRLGQAPGRLLALAGIEARRFWPRGTRPSDAATRAARKALVASGLAANDIGALINTSVCRDYIEPSTACFVHRNLGLAPHCINHDLGNACLGFMDGMAQVAMMIDAGHIRHGMVVAGEGSREVVESTLRLLQQPDAGAAQFRDNFATLTLGSSGVAMVLSHADVARHGHRLEGVVSRAATQHNGLCFGTPSQMTTDPANLLLAGIELARSAWLAATQALPDWHDGAIDVYAPHQVGSRHTQALAKALELPLNKFFLNYATLGNLGPPAVPVSLAQAVESGRVVAGSRVGLMGMGSGLNCSLMSVRW